MPFSKQQICSQFCNSLGDNISELGQSVARSRFQVSPLEGLARLESLVLSLLDHDETILVLRGLNGNDIAVDQRAEFVAVTVGQVQWFRAEGLFNVPLLHTEGTCVTGDHPLKLGRHF